MRENLETYLEGGDRTGDFDAHVPFHVEAAYRRYLAPPDGWATDNDQGVGTDEWPDMDQTAGDGGDTWG